MNAAEQQALSAWWTQHMGPLQAPLQFMPLTGGQSNPTYRVSSGGQQWVLRSQPGGALLASAHAVDREYRVMQALADTDVPVPRMRALCTDASVIGRSFYVMDFIDGPSMNDVMMRRRMDPRELMIIAHRVAEGWTYGPEKRPDLKQHHCIVPFDQLPREQQAKDYLFRAVLIPFLILALAIFLMVKQINRLKRAAPAPAPAAAPPTPEDVLLLREIRDSLKQKG